MAAEPLDVKAFEARLGAAKQELAQAAASAAESTGPVALDQQAVGRVSRADAMQRQAMAQAQDRQRRRELVRIDQALSRIAEGEYGYCTSCGEPIAPKRLEVDPAAAECITCAR